MRKALFVTVACIFALAVSTGGQIGDTYAEEYDYETGAVLSEDVGEEMAEGIEPQARRTISLSVPEFVFNGDVFIAQVNYDPPISGKVTEKFIFKWPTNPICTDINFKEKTIRIKKVKWDNVSGSYLYVLAPELTCVKGTFTAKVIVTKGTTTWKAKAPMQIDIVP